MSNTCCCWTSGIALLWSSVGLCWCCHFHGKLRWKSICVYLHEKIPRFIHNSNGFHVHTLCVAARLQTRNFHENVFHSSFQCCFTLSRSKFSRELLMISVREMNHVKGQFLKFSPRSRILNCYVFLFFSLRFRDDVVSRGFANIFLIFSSHHVNHMENRKEEIQFQFQFPSTWIFN